MENFIKRATNLISVKSIVTLTLTGVFAYMAIKGTISQDFMTIYAVIIAFYFGVQTQSSNVEKLNNEVTQLKTENENMANLISAMSMPMEVNKNEGNSI
nr:MAG: hypothetical protein [Bacteriophage sp.]